MTGLVLILAQLPFTSPVYPQGISCDPKTGILYTLTDSGDPYNPLRTPNGCRVNIETGQISCAVAPPSGLAVVVQ
jgi:hypothetical protein